MSETTLPNPLDEAIERLAPLTEPARRRVFGVVAAATAPVTREEAAAGAGLPVALTTFHLEKLLEAGLLEASFATPADALGDRRRRGRPAKRYRTARADISLSFPARNYRLAAELLAAALPPEVAATSLGEAARRRGRTIGHTVGGDPERLVETLAREGYLPRVTERRIEFGNCPFDGLAQAHAHLMCPANHALLEGILEGSGIAMEAQFEPGEGRCCVVLEPSGEPATGPMHAES